MSQVAADPDAMTPPSFITLLSIVAIVLPALVVATTWAVIWHRRRWLRAPSLSRGELWPIGSTFGKEFVKPLRRLAVAEVVVGAGNCLVFGLLAVFLCRVFVLGPDATWEQINNATFECVIPAMLSSGILIGGPAYWLAEFVDQVGQELPDLAGPRVADTGREWVVAALIAAIAGVMSGGITYPAAWLCISLANVKLAGLCGHIGAACEVPSLEDASGQAMRSWRICSLATALLYTLALTLTARSGEWWFFPALLAPLLGFIGYATYHIVVVLRMAADALKAVPGS